MPGWRPELAVLLERRVGRVIRRDGVDGAVGERLAAGASTSRRLRAGGFTLHAVS